MSAPEITPAQVHATLGRIAITFAALEHEIQLIIVKLAFRGEWLTASALIEDRTLARNLAALKRLGATLEPPGSSLLDRFVKKTDAIRERRNLFVHGTWTINAAVLKEGVVRIRSGRVTVAMEKNDKVWSRGTTEELTFGELRDIEAEVLSCLQDAKILHERLEPPDLID